MKKVLPILAILALFTITIVSCNSKPSATADANAISSADTLGLAQFQSWKMQNERLDPNQYYQQAVMRTPVATAPAKKTASKPNYGSGSMNSSSTNYAKTTQKKGWSKAAKGAVIGGGGGAIAGAVINKKNRVVGGVIGGVAGAAIGYIIGHSQDKKDGR